MKRRTFLRLVPVISTGGCLENRREGSSADVGKNPPSSQPTTPSPTPHRVSTGRFEDFEDLSRWNVVAGSLSADESVYTQGSQSARLRISDSDSAVRIARQFQQPIDLTGHSVTAAVRASSNAYPWIRLIDTGGDSLVLKAVVREVLPLQRVNFGINDVEGDPDLSSISEIRIENWVGEDRTRTIWSCRKAV